MDKIKIAFAGETLEKISGFSYIMTSIIKRWMKSDPLGKKYEFAFINIAGDSCVKVNETYFNNKKEHLNFVENIVVYDCDFFNKEKCLQFDNVVERFRPDIIISLIDPWYLDQIAFSKLRDSFFWASYVTVETPKYPDKIISSSFVHPERYKSIKDILNRADIVIPTSKMGKNSLENLKIDNLVDHIYCGLDTDKKSNYINNKSLVFGGSIKDDDFVFMTLGVNNRRKRIDRTLEAFALFLEGKEDKSKYKLYCHSDIIKNYGGTDLVQLVNDLKIYNNVVFMNYKKQYSKEEIYSFYNNSDCFILLTGGEGFCYPVVEAMLHNKPVIYTDYGTQVETGQNYGLPVKINDFFNESNGYIQYALADKKDAVEKMNYVVDEIKKGFLNIKSEKYIKDTFDWNKVFPKFQNVILDHFEKKDKDIINELAIRRVI